MSDHSAIEWTQTSWNPVLGCSKVSAGCQHCYAVGHVHRMAGSPNATIAAANAGLTARHRNGQLDWTGVVRLIPERLGAPLRWREPRRVFVNSLSDLFHGELTDAEIARVFGVMWACHDHRFQVLTKRPDRAAKLLADDGFYDLVEDAAMGYTHYDAPWPLANVWLGTSVEDQAAADDRIPHLLAAPAAVRFLSCEPLLGPLELSEWLGARRGTHTDERGNGLSAGYCGRVGDRRGGAHLAHSGAALGPMAGPDQGYPVPQATGGEGRRAVPPSAEHGQWCPDLCPGASAGVPALLRTHRETDHQPREREQAGQSAQQSGPRNVLGADETRDADVGLRPREEPAISWVIIGGESGPGARGLQADWVNNLLSDVWAEHEVRTFFKQTGSVWAHEHGYKDRKGGDPSEWPAAWRIREYPKVGGL